MSVPLPRWSRFRSAHLFDYQAPAARLWGWLVALGGTAAAAAAWQLATAPATAWAAVLGGWALVALAAAFPLQMPRSRQSLSLADLLIFLILAQLGAAAAMLAAALEAVVASSRTSKRLSSRVGSPAINTLAMAVGAAVAAGAEAVLKAWGWPGAPALVAALAAAACANAAVSTGLMMKLLHMKTGLAFGLHSWAGAASWVAAVQLGSATLAGLLALQGRQHGPAALAVGLAVLGVLTVLLRTHLQQRLAEQTRQEARVAAAEAEARLNQRRFSSAFMQASIGMAIVAPDGRVLQANQALVALLGLQEQALLQCSFPGLLPATDAALLAPHTANLLARRSHQFTLDLRCRAAGGTLRWVSLHGARFDDEAEPGTPAQTAAGSGLIYQLHDIDQRRRAEHELRHIAFHDTLTGLANRHGFLERLRSAVGRRRDDPTFSFAVLVLDLDRFKTVNDNLGHRGGDELLRQLAARLSGQVPAPGLVARLGGDEFAVLLENTPPEPARQRGEQLLSALAEPVHVRGTELRPQASLGLRHAEQGHAEVDELLRDADLAMYEAKATGKGRLAVFEPGLRAAVGDQLQLEADLRRAIDRGELSLAYQPLYTLQERQLSGFEALARWTHPQRGPISPAVFIALAEETGCIHELTRWAIDEAVRQQARWLAEAGGEALVMHVNVSGRDLSQPGFVAQVLQTLRQHGLPPHQLLLEVTESTLMAQRELSLKTLNELGHHGVKLGIDDFGTGYSSLAYLSTLPFDCLKIDRSFVIGMTQSAENLEIVRTVVRMGRALNKQVVAEGIETPEQLLQLRSLGATLGQGYGLSRPLTAEHAGQLLGHHALHDHCSPP